MVSKLQLLELELSDKRNIVQVLTNTLRQQEGKFESEKERLEQEARALSSVAHPNIVQYFDWFKDADPAFIVIEFLQGRR